MKNYIFVFCICDPGTGSHPWPHYRYRHIHVLAEDEDQAYDIGKRTMNLTLEELDRGGMHVIEERPFSVEVVRE